MRKLFVLWGCLVLAVVGRAAERVFEFKSEDEGKPPTGFTNLVAGLGRVGDWRIIADEVAPTFKPITPNAPRVTYQPVLAQKSRSLIDAHYPILLFDGETFADFTFTTRFKIVEGDVDQMAGIVFRFRDVKNFYVLRASVKDGTLRFYKMNNGQVERLIGPKVEFKLGEWRELSVECQGNQIRCRLDGKEVIPMLTDSGFPNGKIGFWTKSDTVACFSGARVRFTPQVPAAQVLVQDVLRQYPRLVGLRIVMATGSPAEPRIVADKDEGRIGQPADAASRDVLQTGKVFYGKEQDVARVTIPLRDRNGETIAAVKVSLNSFVGQTEQNAIARAQPIVKEMQARVQTVSDLVE